MESIGLERDTHARQSAMTQTASSAGARYCVFETAIGFCGVAWSDAGITRVLMLESSHATAERRLADRSAGTRSDEPPAPIAQVIAEIQRYARGERVDFSPAAVD